MRSANLSGGKHGADRGWWGGQLGERRGDRSRGDRREPKRGLHRCPSTLSVQIGTKLECQVPKVRQEWGWCVKIHSSSWEQNKEFQRIFWN